MRGLLSDKMMLSHLSNNPTPSSCSILCSWWYLHSTEPTSETQPELRRKQGWGWEESWRNTGDSRCRPPGVTTNNISVNCTAGLSYIEYFSLARVEQVTIDHTEDQVECQPDEIPRSGVKYFLWRLKYFHIFTLHRSACKCFRARIVGAWKMSQTGWLSPPEFVNIRSIWK